MPLTREFKDTVQARLKQDRKYRKELLREGVESLLAGDLDTGKAILRDYINATIGFEELSRVTKRPTKSLMRMFGPAGNPQARNLFEVIGHLQRAEGSSSSSPSKPRAKRYNWSSSHYRASSPWPKTRTTSPRSS